MTMTEQTAHAVVAHMDEGQKRALTRFEERGNTAISDYRKAQLTARALLHERGGCLALTDVGVDALHIIREGQV